MFESMTNPSSQKPCPGLSRTLLLRIACDLLNLETVPTLEMTNTCYCCHSNTLDTFHHLAPGQTETEGKKRSVDPISFDHFLVTFGFRNILVVDVKKKLKNTQGSRSERLAK